MGEFNLIFSPCDTEQEFKSWHHLFLLSMFISPQYVYSIFTTKKPWCFVSQSNIKSEK